MPGDRQTGRKNTDAAKYLADLVPPNKKGTKEEQDKFLEQRNNAEFYGEQFLPKIDKWTQELQNIAPLVPGPSEETALYKAFLQNLPKQIDHDGRLGDSPQTCRIDPRSGNPKNPPVVHNRQNRAACVGRLLPGFPGVRDNNGICSKAMASGLWGTAGAGLDACKGHVLSFPIHSLDKYSYAGQTLAGVLSSKVKTMMDIDTYGESPWHDREPTGSFHLEVWGAYKTFAAMDGDDKKQSFYINWILRLRLFSFLDKLHNLNQQQALLWDSFLRTLDKLVEASASLNIILSQEPMGSRITSARRRYKVYKYRVKDPQRPPPTHTTRPRQQIFFCQTRQELTELSTFPHIDEENVIVVETQWLPEILEGIMPSGRWRTLDLINFFQYFCTIHKTETEIFQGWWLNESHIMLRFFDRTPETTSNPSKLLEVLVSHVLRMASVSVFLVPLLRMDPQKRFIEHLMQATAALEKWGGTL